MRNFAKLGLVMCGFLSVTQAVLPRTSVSLGYGLQLNSMLNTTLNANVQKAIFNESGKSISGYSGTQFYSTNWSATDSADAKAYPLVHLPELRIATDWAAKEMRLGVFGSVSGLIPQTSAYYLGSVSYNESNSCGVVNYTLCPLAAVNFVSTGGNATYAAELRSNLRFSNVTAGMTLGKKIGNIWNGDLSFTGELGLNVQTFAVTTQFAAARCTTGGSTPCAQNSQVRVIQAELKTSSVYALGPVLGANLRYERPQSFWFVEATATVTFLFTRLENSGYTSFTAAGTQAFSQTGTAAGIDATQNIFAVLPAVLIRFGVHL